MIWPRVQRAGLRLLLSWWPRAFTLIFADGCLNIARLFLHVSAYICVSVMQATTATALPALAPGHGVAGHIVSVSCSAGCEVRPGPRGELRWTWASPSSRRGLQLIWGTEGLQVMAAANLTGLVILLRPGVPLNPPSTYRLALLCSSAGLVLSRPPGNHRGARCPILNGQRPGVEHREGVHAGLRPGHGWPDVDGWPPPHPYRLPGLAVQIGMEAVVVVVVGGAEPVWSHGGRPVLR